MYVCMQPRKVLRPTVQGFQVQVVAPLWDKQDEARGVPVNQKHKTQKEPSKKKQDSILTSCGLFMLFPYKTRSPRAQDISDLHVAFVVFRSKRKLLRGGT